MRSAATRTDHGGGAMYDEIVYLLMASGSLHPTRRGGSPRDVHHPGYRPRLPQSHRNRWCQRWPFVHHLAGLIRLHKEPVPMKKLMLLALVTSATVLPVAY